MKNKYIYLLAFILLIITFKYSLTYKTFYIELVNLFIYLFFPSLFPTIFLTNLISRSISFDKLNKNIAKILIITLCLIGGSLTAINTLNKLKFNTVNEKEKFLTLTTGGSFSYYLLAFSYYWKYNYLILAITIFLIKLFICNLLIKDLTFENQDLKNNIIFDSLNSSFISLFNMLKSLALITIILPIFYTIKNSYLSNFLLGLIEFTRAGLRIAKLNTPLSLFFLVFIVDFNGLTTFIQIKMSHKDVRQYKIILNKLPLSLFISSLFCLLTF